MKIYNAAKSFLDWTKSFWNWIVNWLEHGDLVILMVIVSAAHYAVVLAEKDHIISAVAIGILVDVGHFRLVRGAVRYAGDNNAERFARWVFAIATTIVSFAYHQRFYNDFLLAAPMPFLIATLAWLNHIDKKPSKSQSEAVKSQSETTQSQSDAMQSQGTNEAKTFVAQCSQCDWSHNHYQTERAMRNALNAHQRTHKEKI